MSEGIRYLFDTNTLISAVLFEHSKPWAALRRALRQGRVLLSSSAEFLQATEEKA